MEDKNRKSYVPEWLTKRMIDSYIWKTLYNYEGPVYWKPPLYVEKLLTISKNMYNKNGIYNQWGDTLIPTAMEIQDCATVIRGIQYDSARRREKVEIFYNKLRKMIEQYIKELVKNKENELEKKNKVIKELTETIKQLLYCLNKYNIHIPLNIRKYEDTNTEHDTTKKQTRTFTCEDMDEIVELVNIAM